MTEHDIEKDEKISTVRAVVVENPRNGEPMTVATSIYGDDSVAGIPGGNVSVISVEPSIFQLATVGEPVDPNERRAVLCCGCCCDLLRACIIVDSLFICFAFLGLLFSWWGISYYNDIDLSTTDDDTYIDMVTRNKAYAGIWFPIAICVQASGILFATLGIVGASKFSKCLVLAAGIWYCIDLVFAGLWQNWTGILIRGFFAYPHFALYAALRNGDITKDEYMRERHCCCDARPKR